MLMADLVDLSKIRQFLLHWSYELLEIGFV